MAHTQENHECQKTALPSLCVRKTNEEWGRATFPAHMRVNESVGGVCMWARTKNTATHHYPTITNQLTTEVFNVVVD